MRLEVPHGAKSTVVRLARVIRRYFRHPEDFWLDWGKKEFACGERPAHEDLGSNPAKMIAARAAAGVGRLVGRSADSVIGRVISWRSAEDVAAMKEVGGRQEPRPMEAPNDWPLPPSVGGPMADAPAIAGGIPLGLFYRSRWRAKSSSPASALSMTTRHLGT